MHRILFIIFLSFCFTDVFAQFPPQVGKPGTTAIHYDSLQSVPYLNPPAKIIRGWQNISDTLLGRVNVGDPEKLRPFGNEVLSLGDGGYAEFEFSSGSYLTNDVGSDFVIFENGFEHPTLDTGTAYVELAFVEVSSDGEHFFRFPAVSLTDTFSQIGSFEGTRADKIHNLAGKYIAPYGTPFELDELPDTLLLNKMRITHIRIVDVVGSINDSFATRDVFGNKINDPWPTPFASSGFDLSSTPAILHPLFLGYTNSRKVLQISVYPNPVRAGGWVSVNIKSTGNKEAQIYNTTGISILPEMILQDENMKFKFEESGLYLIKVSTDEGFATRWIHVH